MAEEKESEEKEREDRAARIEKMREKMREMQPGGGRSQTSGPMGHATLMQRMVGTQGAQQNRALMESIQKLRGDVQEMKGYLKEILETLKNQE